MFRTGNPEPMSGYKLLGIAAYLLLENRRSSDHAPRKINDRIPLHDTQKKMKNTICNIIVRQLFPLLLTGSLAVAANNPELEKLRHTVLSPTSEQVILQLNGSYIPKVFTLKDESPRVIFDFPDMRYGKEVKSITITKGAIVKRIRVGMHTDEAVKTRVVFDMASLQGVTYTQKFDEKSSALVIQFTTPAKAAVPGADSTTGNAAKKDVPEKNPTKVTEQAQPEATVDVTAPSKTEAPKADGIASQPIAKTTAPQPTITTEESDKKISPAPLPQKEESGITETSATSQTAQPEDAVKIQPAVKPPSPQPALTAPKTDEKKMLPPATAVQPQPDETTVSKASAKTEATKPAAAIGAGAGPLIESIRFDGNSPKGEMVLFKLNDFHPPTIHGVEEGIPRIICDFNNTKLAESAKNTIKADGKFVKVIRITKNKTPDRIRVVLDLEPNRSYDLQQVFFKEDNLFVIIVNTVKK